MNKTTLLLGFAGAIAVSSAAGAQTATTGGTTVITTTTTASSSPSTGAYQKLSPGNQSIVDALYQSQTTSTGTTTSTPTGTTTTTVGTAPMLTRDQIAAMKGSDGGWGRVFQDMKANGYTDAKNLGEVVSTYRRDANADRKAVETTSATGTTTTSAKGASSERSGRFVRDDSVAITTARGGTEVVGRGGADSNRGSNAVASGDRSGSSLSNSGAKASGGSVTSGSGGHGGSSSSGGSHGQGKH